MKTNAAGGGSDTISAKFSSFVLYLENGAFDNADSKEIKMIFFEF